MAERDLMMKIKWYRFSVAMFLTTSLVGFSFTTPSIAQPPATDLFFWLDGNDLDGDGTPEGAGEAGISGGVVTEWVDKAGSHNVSQATGAFRCSIPIEVLAQEMLKSDG